MKEYRVPIQSLIDHIKTATDVDPWAKEMAEELLKEQEKKEIKLHKKHVITWKRDDEFTMRKLYEAICETLLDEGELFIARTDDHEKVDFVFYVACGRMPNNSMIGMI